MLILEEIIGVIMLRLEYAYLLGKNIGPLTEAMHTKVTHGESFSLDKNPQISQEKYCC